MKRGSFFARMYGKTGGRLPSLCYCGISFSKQKNHPLQGNGWRWCKAPYFLLISLEYLAKYTVRIKKHSTLGT